LDFGFHAAFELLDVGLGVGFEPHEHHICMTARAAPSQMRNENATFAMK
jgi:hypothetical protein